MHGKAMHGVFSTGWESIIPTCLDDQMSRNAIRRDQRKRDFMERIPMALSFELFEEVNKGRWGDR
jgi:hypothetical protein